MIDVLIDYADYMNAQTASTRKFRASLRTLEVFQQIIKLHVVFRLVYLHLGEVVC